MNVPVTKGFEFAGYRFAPNMRLLWRDGEPLALTDRVSRMLAYLIEQRGRIVSQTELLEALWHDTHVADANVRVTMNRLRTLLREDENETPLILTIPKQGYRFVADVAVRFTETTASVAAKALGKIAPQEKLYTDQLFLRGRQLIESHEPHAFEKGLHFLREAVRLNPQMIEAWVGIANAYTYLGTFHINSPHNVFPLAEQALQKARALDADEPTLLAAQANFLLMSRWDAAESGRLVQLALQHQPHNATIQYQAGFFELMTGKAASAIETLQRSMALEPLFFPPALALAQAQFQAGQWAAAHATLQNLLVLEEPLNFAHYDLSRLYLNEGKLDEALAAAKRACELLRHPMTFCLQGFVQACCGQYREAAKLIQFVEEMGKRKFLSPYYLAEIYLGLNDFDRAIPLLEAAYTLRMPQLFRLQTEPVFHQWRTDQRMSGLLRQLYLNSSI